MQSKPKRSTTREDAARIPHVHLCHRGFFAGGFCGVTALAAALAVALAAWGRFFVVVCAGAADCRGRFSRGSASTAASPRSRFLGPAACSPRLAGYEVMLKNLVTFFHVTLTSDVTNLDEVQKKIVQE